MSDKQRTSAASDLEKVVKELRARLKAGDVKVVLSKPNDDEPSVHVIKVNKRSHSEEESTIINALAEVFSSRGFVNDESEDSVGKRIYRRADERPDPTLPGNAEVNRLKKQFKLRLDPDMIEEVDQSAKAAGISRQEWVEHVFAAALKGGFDPS